MLRKKNVHYKSALTVLLCNVVNYCVCLVACVCVVNPLLKRNIYRLSRFID